jgi:hypothetical protein
MKGMLDLEPTGQHVCRSVLELVKYRVWLKATMCAHLLLASSTGLVIAIDFSLAMWLEPGNHLILRI